MSNSQQKAVMFSIMVNKFLRNKQAEDFKRGPDTPLQERKSRSVPVTNCRTMPKVSESQVQKVQRNPAKANSIIKRENINF